MKKVYQDRQKKNFERLMTLISDDVTTNFSHLLFEGGFHLTVYLYRSSLVPFQLNIILKQMSQS
jgi:hypothetical protein